MPSGTPKKRTTSKRASPRYASRAREYIALIEETGLNKKERAKLFEFADRTSRRYKRGDGKIPLPALKLMRLIAKGVVTKQQVMQA